MYKNAVQYKDRYLAPGSLAHAMYHNKSKDLDRHLKEVDAREYEVLDRYATKQEFVK